MLLSAFQFVCIFFAGVSIYLLNPASIEFWVTLVGSGASLGIFTPILWNGILNKYQKAKKFPEISFSPRVFWPFFVLVLIAFLLIWMLQMANLGWVVSVVSISLVSVWGLGALLFLGVLQFNAKQAISAGFDLWFKKSLAPGLLAIVLMFSNSLGFMLAKQGLVNNRALGGFSEFPGFVTMCLLVLASLMVLVWFVCFANTFLVLGFLEIIKLEDSGDRQEIKIEESPSPSM